MRKLGIIVDAYSTGNCLSSELKKYDFECIHVQSMPHILIFDVPAFRQNDFIKNIIFRGNVDELVGELSLIDPAFIIPGCESGVILADELSERLGLPSNGINLSVARRDKYLMQMALYRAGIDNIPSFLTSSPKDAIKWCDSELIWPCVVKPIDSAGSDGVIFCANAHDVQHAFDLLLGRTNAMGTINRSLIIQKKLIGTQYIVNTVSANGHHYISEIWKDVRLEVSGACSVGLYETLIPVNYAEGQILRTYAESVLNALEILHGPAHLEIMLTNDQGPMLIEAGARMQGSISHNAVIGALGHSHVTLTAFRYADLNGFMEYMRHPYKIFKHTLAAMLVASSDTLITSSNFSVAIRNLPCYISDLGLPEAGDQIRQTVDMATCPGIIYFAGDSQESVYRDYIAFRKIESEMYGLEETLNV